jgi:methionyl-tRNA formyltransferase
VRLVFMGTAAFAAPAFNALLDAGHDLCCVYTRPPRPAGRGRKPRSSPVHVAAADRGIEIRTPDRFDDAACLALADIRPDAAVVAAYGLILPRAALDAPRLGCINLHASVLPRWRGAAPIQRAILAGDTRTGVSVMQMDEGLDTGPIMAVRDVAIRETDDAGALHDALAGAAASLAVDVVAELTVGTIVARPQSIEGVTYAAKIDPRDRRIDFSSDATAIVRLVRAFSPAPGAWVEVGGERLKVLGAEPGTTVRDSAAMPGTVVDDTLSVACGGGAIRLTRLQRSGRSALDAPAFLRGFPLRAGTLFYA